MTTACKRTRHQMENENLIEFIKDTTIQIKHIKCKTIKAARERLEILKNQPLLPVAKKKPKSFKMNYNFCFLLIIGIVAVLFHAKLKYRCKMFGGSKCYFPYDLLPDFLNYQQRKIIF